MIETLLQKNQKSNGRIQTLKQFKLDLEAQLSLNNFSAKN
jgi:hypothetical protein